MDQERFSLFDTVHKGNRWDGDYAAESVLAVARGACANALALMLVSAQRTPAPERKFANSRVGHGSGPMPRQQSTAIPAMSLPHGRRPALSAVTQSDAQPLNDGK